MPDGYDLVLKSHPRYTYDREIERTFKSLTNTRIEYSIVHSGYVTLNVYDITGKIVKHDVVYAEEGVNEYELDVKAYQSGTYFITLQNNGEIHSEKFVIRR